MEDDVEVYAALVAVTVTVLEKEEPGAPCRGPPPRSFHRGIAARDAIHGPGDSRVRGARNRRRELLSAGHQHRAVLSFRLNEILIVTEPETDFVLSAWLVAVMLTLCGVGTIAGAV